MTPQEFTALRTGHTLSRKLLAQNLGLSVSQLSRYESGRTPIPWLVECHMRALPRAYDILDEVRL
jgi:transcriptional regulator with XRE-family HTH domain